MAAKASMRLPRYCVLQNRHGYAFGESHYVYFKKRKESVRSAGGL